MFEAFGLNGDVMDSSSPEWERNEAIQEQRWAEFSAVAGRIRSSPCAGFADVLERAEIVRFRSYDPTDLEEEIRLSGCGYDLDCVHLIAAVLTLAERGMPNG